MASSSKKKTTFAKMNREAAVRDRRLHKEAKRAARKQAALVPADEPNNTPVGDEIVEEDQPTAE